MPYTPPAASLDHLGTITNLIAHATPIAKEITKKPALFAKLPGGQIYFDTDLELDTDGWPGGPGGDSSWQAHTSLRYNDDSSLNANTVPYFVLPGPPDWYTALGVAKGDYAAVIFKTKLAFAVFGDVGPEKKLGEGSIELLRRLGVDRMKPNGTVVNAGIDPHILTIVFPGSGDPIHRSDEASLIAAIGTTAKSLFNALGGNADAAPLVG